MFIQIDNDKYITAINKKLIRFFDQFDYTDDFRLIVKNDMDTMTIISSDHENEIQFFRNHLSCPRILKMIRRNK